MTNFSGMEERIRDTIVRKLCTVTGKSRISSALVKVSAGEDYVVVTFRDNNAFNAVAAARSTANTINEMDAFADGPVVRRDETEVILVDTPENVAKKLDGRIYDRQLKAQLSGAVPAYSAR